MGSSFLSLTSPQVVFQTVWKTVLTKITWLQLHIGPAWILELFIQSLMVLHTGKCAGSASPVQGRCSRSDNRASCWWHWAQLFCFHDCCIQEGNFALPVGSQCVSSLSFFTFFCVVSDTWTEFPVYPSKTLWPSPVRAWQLIPFAEGNDAARGYWRNSYHKPLLCGSIACRQSK